MRASLWVALVLSLAVAVVSFSLWQRADARADAAEIALAVRDESRGRSVQAETWETAIQRHEQALVEKHRPAVVKLCRMFGVDAPPADIGRIDELMKPIEGIVAGLSK